MFRIYASLITLVFTLACSPKNDEKKITVSNSEALDSPRSSESKELPSTMIKYHKYEKIKLYIGQCLHFVLHQISRSNLLDFGLA